jgi:hypothetical protein
MVSLSPKNDIPKQRLHNPPDTGPYIWRKEVTNKGEKRRGERAVTEVVNCQPEID